MAMTKKDIPPKRPRFSVAVASAKYSIQIGIPSPKDTPYKKDIIKRFTGVTFIKIGNKEDKNPINNHIKRKIIRRLNQLAIFVLLRAEAEAPPKLSVHMIAASKLDVFAFSTSFLKTVKAKKYQIKLLINNKVFINMLLNGGLFPFKVMILEMI
jgi:hypothetical protein